MVAHKKGTCYSDSPVFLLLNVVLIKMRIILLAPLLIDILYFKTEPIIGMSTLFFAWKWRQISLIKCIGLQFRISFPYSQ